MSNLSFISSRTTISTLDSWEQISSWYQNLMEDKYSLLDAAKEKVKTVYNYVALHINHVPQHKWSSGNYEPHSAAKIFKTKAGGAHDQSTLLIVLLKEIEIAAQPGLINTSYQPTTK